MDLRRALFLVVAVQTGLLALAVVSLLFLNRVWALSDAGFAFILLAFSAEIAAALAA
ncbi:MAG: hypothetical protein NT016_01700 [Candidatus Aenigmarchaeota archaeon]|nr:hypothetical protein [Candidatus Aenigmarchaeota archaeon]